MKKFTNIPKDFCKFLFINLILLGIPFLCIGQKYVRTTYNALVLEYDPNLGSSQNFQKVSEYLNLRNVDTLCKEYIKALRLTSGGTVIWNVKRKFVLNEFPAANDPAINFTSDNYVSLRNQGFDYWNHGGPNYSKIINDNRFDIINSIENGEIDAVWIFGLPGTGFWETAMAGDGAYWVNGGPINGINCSKKFVLYGFGRESHQGVGYMLENTAHMIENIMGNRISPSWPKKWEYKVWNTFDLSGSSRTSYSSFKNDWQRFTLSDAVNYNPEYTSTGNAQIGTAHFPPGAMKNYGFFSTVCDFRFSTSFWNDGDWINQNETYKHVGNSYAKSFWYEGTTPIIVSDFIFEGDVILPKTNTPSHAGFLFRTVNYKNGKDACKGYYVGLSSSENKLTLAKIDNSFSILKTAAMSVEADRSYHIKIYAIDSLISIYVNGDPLPLIKFIDQSFSSGGLGLCTYDTEATFDNLYANAYVNTFEKVWYKYPNLIGNATRMNAKDWDENHDYWFYWWFEHLPKNTGVHTDKHITTNIETEGILNTWWPYIFDINQFSSPSFGNTQVVFPENYNDVTVPSVPDVLKIGDVSSSSIPLFWNDGSDNIGITRYEVYRNDSLIQTTPLKSFRDNGFFSDTLYKYTIKARDGSGNVSQGISVDVKITNRKAIVYNGNFEEGIGTRVFGWAINAFKIENTRNSWISSGAGINQSGCLYIENTKANDSRWCQQINGLIPGASYILKGYIKGEDIDRTTGVGANICLEGTWDHTPSLSGTFDWTEAEMSIVAPASGSITIGCRLGYWSNIVTGKVWFDNISIIPVKPSIQSTDLHIYNITDSSATLKYTPGNGNKRIVFISDTDSENPVPTLGSSYVSNPIFGKGDKFNKNWYCVANGEIIGDELTITGLMGGSFYKVIVLEYNGKAGSENYLTNSAEKNPASFETQKRSQKIAFKDIGTKTYGDADFVLTATSSSGLPVHFSSSNENIVSIINGVVHVKNAGSVNITASQFGNKYFNPANDVIVSLVIQKALLTVSAQNKLKVYGETNPLLTITYSGFVNEDELAAIDELPKVYTAATETSEIGEYEIQLTGGLDDNYDFYKVNGILHIEKADLIVKADDKTRAYLEKDPQFSISYSGFINDDNVNCITEPVIYSSANDTSSIGEYDILLSGGGAKNYNLHLYKGKLTILKANQSITISAIEPKTYGDNDFILEAVASSGLNVTYTIDNPAIAEIDKNNAHILNAGNGLITVFQPGNVNFKEAEPVSTILNIRKAKLTVSVKDTSRKVGEDNPAFILQYNGFVNNENLNVLDNMPTAFCAADKQSPEGQYDILLSGGVAKNYAFVYESSKLNVINTTWVNFTKSREIQIYPNPTHSFLIITYEGSKPYPLVIRDIFGRSVINTQMYDDILNVDKLSSGVYYLTIDNCIVKFVKY